MTVVHVLKSAGVVPLANSHPNTLKPSPFSLYSSLFWELRDKCVLLFDRILDWILMDFNVKITFCTFLEKVQLLHARA